MMKKITNLIKQHKTSNAAAKSLGVHPMQLKRFVEYGAMVDDDGNVWVKRGKVNVAKNEKV